MYLQFRINASSLRTLQAPDFGHMGGEQEREIISFCDVLRGMECLVQRELAFAYTEKLQRRHPIFEIHG